MQNQNQNLNQNPYESPTTDSDSDLSPPGSVVHASSGGTARFFAWYFGAFIFCTLLWHMSGYFRAIDLLELPMAAFHFPLAGFFEPSRFLVRDEFIFYYALLFWGAVIPVAFQFAPKRLGPLATALGIIVACATTSTVFAFVYNLFGWGQIA